ncbi:secreted fungalysin-like metallopeptidase [Psychroflexus torquis ATCC 700755]|uniref:Secreted fungalysin-like metallopeptidase n=1 Tax=Psychroflexus torquis (strain ATCC 700755 / CIP 106069 / ACAM 623) TaxID=313595 RepID=K4IEE5_PSYTT|nr:T9SS-dependent M36 family metallopeptidase [Psychroflexus torquis]AFU68932.1 secreted fungalysin-like metallopeptidase [Psychroflexus torquis ATCC 700755]
MKSKLLLFLLVFSSVSLVSAQTEIDIVKNYLEQKKSENLLLTDDFSDLILASQHFSKSTNADIIYAQQTYSGIPIHNAIGNFVLRNSSVKYAKYDYEVDLASRISTQSPVLTPEQALNAASTLLGIGNPTNISIVGSKSSNNLILSKSGVSIDDIPVQLVYYKSESGVLNLAWDLSIHMIDGSHWWSVRVDASNGRILDKMDWIVNCNFDHSTIVGRTFRPPFQIQETTGANLLQDGAVYNVYPYPVESPIHGDRAIVTDPSDNEFSPFGWHDTNGEVGPDHTITRGNNVHAYEDRGAVNVPGYSPDGGDDLNFDFPLDFNQPPQLNEDAAITNLFYWNNIIHDMWSYYGFDEASGNFQQTNYTAQAFGNDYVRAEAQDGGGLNNANFGTPPDGSRPRMQMFLWSSSGPPEAPLTVETPESLAGDYDGVPAGFGPALTSEAIIANFALAKDEEIDPDENDICQPITNPSELDQKIVIIRRGDCTFVSKILLAQEAGALAVIMVNNVPGAPITMGGEDTGDIVIPSIMVNQADGEAIIDALIAEENVSGFLVNSGPYQIDGDFDNGIIAHEYGHGISNRLTAGAQNASCLGNEEQMGEGWSDWLGLMMTISADDIATEGRGIGTYAINQEITGLGIRPFRYSTNFSVNPATYDYTNRPSISRPHGIGFVWATMLWDLNWALIDQYGFDSDLYNGTGGNNFNMQLVIDGMKLQGCSPGFIDGRDAILEADILANDGVNQCLIWEVFAKRGLGWSAEQGSSGSRSDQTEAFDLPPNEDLNCALSSDGFGAETFGIYPNPAKDYFNLSLTNTDLSNSKVDIYDLNGKLVLSKMSDSNQRVDVQQLNSGMYVVLVESGSKTFTQKLLVQ